MEILIVSTLNDYNKYSGSIPRIAYVAWKT